MSKPTLRQDVSELPGRSHYSLEYSRDGRLFSYAHQINTVLSLEPQRVLEIGVGDGVVAAAIRATGIEVTTVDIQSELSPDVVGSVTALPLDDDAFDTALCCQVLEHLPFDESIEALMEIGRVTKHALVVSLPDITRYVRVIVGRPPRGHPRVWSMTLPWLRSPSFPEERLRTAGHYWEIGYRGYTLHRFRAVAARCGWRLQKTWRVAEKPWHRFFLFFKTTSKRDE